jgi:CheY-like chemotaxis protein
MEHIEKPVFKGEVLLCEDNKMNQQIICSHLDKVGLKTVVVVNGKEGVEAVRRRMPTRFDLIFMDILMPVMDGLEAAAEILKLNTGTPIIAMAANTSPDDRKRYEACGMPDCLGKPFTSQELWGCLLKHLTPVNQNVTDDVQEYDEIFRRKLMGMFVDQHKNKYYEITSAIDSGDIELARRLAHNLKSNSEALGKQGLQKAAKGIENHLKDADTAITQEEFNTLRTELDAALKEFASFTN